MSIWTQINGSVTIRDLQQIKTTSIEEIKEVFGKTCDFSDGDDNWDACTVPCGSEGSLQYFIHKVDCTYVTWVISIIGALRDYEDIEEIKEWFEKIIKSGLFIREATLEVYVEDRPKICFSRGRDEEGSKMLLVLKEKE